MSITCLDVRLLLLQRMRHVGNERLVILVAQGGGL
jgi:hypothetical protein